MSTVTLVVVIMSSKNTRGQYWDEALKKSVRAIQEDGISYGVAAKTFGIPKPTIHKYAKETIALW